MVALGRVLDSLNQEHKSQVKNWLNEALGAIEGAVRYEKLELGKHQIGKDNVIVERYFEELENGDC